MCTIEGAPRTVFTVCLSYNTNREVVMKRFQSYGAGTRIVFLMALQRQGFNRERAALVGAKDR